MASKRHQRSRQVRLRRTIAAAATLVVVVIAIVFAVTSAGHRRGVADSCQVVGESTGAIYRMVPDQLANASTIADLAMRRGLPQQAVVVALATAMQESKLTNLDYGDRDSIGLFQQRPSQGWGAKAQLLDPVYASGKFFDALVKVRGWQGLTVAAAAQAVQRSGFPDAYGSWQQRATAMAAALTGTTSGRLTCRLAHPGVNVKGATTASASGAASSAPPTPTSVLSAVATLTADLATDLDVSAPTVVAAGSKAATITVSGLQLIGTGGDSLAMHRTDSVASWAVAHATSGITRVVSGDQEWRPERDGWHHTGSAAPSGSVIMTVAAS
jgi:hypothetical protein